MSVSKWSRHSTVRYRFEVTHGDQQRDAPHAMLKDSVFQWRSQGSLLAHAQIAITAERFLGGEAGHGSLKVVDLFF